MGKQEVTNEANTIVAGDRIAVKVKGYDDLVWMNVIGAATLRGATAIWVQTPGGGIRVVSGGELTDLLVERRGHRDAGDEEQHLTRFRDAYRLAGNALRAVGTIDGEKAGKSGELLDAVLEAVDEANDMDHRRLNEISDEKCREEG